MAAHIFRDTPVKYNTLAAGLHWLMAILLIAQATLGWWMLDLPKSPPGLRAGWFNLHKSLGLVLGLLIIARLLWRLRHPAPELPEPMPRWQKAAAQLTHALLYLCMVILPLTGFLGSLFTKYPVKFFGLTIPFGMWDRPWAKELFSTVHNGAAWCLAALVVLHLAAVLLHSVRHDSILYRMSLRGRSPVERHLR